MAQYYYWAHVEQALRYPSGHSIQPVHMANSTPKVFAGVRLLTRMKRGFRLRNTKTIRPQITIGEGIPANEHWKVFEFVPLSARASEQLVERHDNFPRSVER